MSIKITICNINRVMKVLSTKPKKEEALVRRLVSLTFKKKVIQYVIGIVTWCGEENIELEKEKK